MKNLHIGLVFIYSNLVNDIKYNAQIGIIYNINTSIN